MNIFISTSSFGKEDSTPLELLKREGFNVQTNPYGRQLTIEESASLLDGAVGLIAGTEKLNEDSLANASALKYIVRLGTGMDNVDFTVANAKGIKVENTPDAHVNGVAELALAGILCALRGVSESDRSIRGGNWVKPMGSLLTGKTVGLVGMGKIAKRLIQLLSPFQCRILAYDPYFDEDFARAYNVTSVDLADVYTNSNIISLHLPFSSANKHLVNDASFARMKKDVLVVNTSRGGLINEEHLYNFLSENTAAKAYLDTFEKEPYSGPLNELPNILCTGHIGTYAKEVRLEMEMEAAQKLINYFRES